jgi:hypothetical protein
MDVGARMVLKTFLCASFLVSACAATPSAKAPTLALAGTDDATHALAGSSARATVYVFFSEHCPCMRAHDARLVALANDYASRNVRFFAIDSEVGATIASEKDRALARNYPFPILVDEGARAARALGAEYSTYSVVVDERGDVVYRGGLDSDHTHLTNDAAPYLRDALDDVIAGRTVRHPQTEALGCALRTW